MNSSGIHPLERNVLIFPDSVEEKKGSIYMPDSVRDQEKFAQVKATVVAVSPAAFDDLPSECAVIPGDRVYTAKYAGVNVKGQDGKEYRIVKDVDIAAKIEG